MESVIARGGMGVVYEAIDQVSGQKVALKTLPADLPNTHTRQRRFEREVASLSELHHPHVVQLFGVGSADQRPFMILEFVPGTNLRECIRSGPLPIQTAAILARNIAIAIAFAHSRNIVHRDLTPSNILIGFPAGQPIPGKNPLQWQKQLCDIVHQPHFSESQIVIKVSDFGLALFNFGSQSVTRTEGLCGTPGYFVPESVMPQLGEVGPRSDIYGIGALLYAMLTSRAPFVGSTINESIAQMMDSEILAPSILRQNIPPNLETICLKCLERHPAHRYQSVTALLADLERYLQGQRIAAKPPPIWRKVLAWARRSRATIMLSVAMAVLGLVLSAAIAWNEFSLGGKLEAARIESRFNEELEKINESFKDSMRVVRTLAAFLECQPAITRESFDRFVEAALLDGRAALTLEWLPRVAAEERRDHERWGRAEYGDAYSIRWQSPEKNLIDAGDSREYFPVFLLNPLPGNRQALGFDVYSEAIRREAMERAWRTGNLAASGNIELVQGAESGSVLAFMPVHYLVEPDVGQDPSNAIRGFAAGVFRVDQIVQPVLDRFRNDLEVGIYDLTRNGEPLFESPHWQETSSEREQSDGRNFLRKLVIGGRIWEFRGFISDAPAVRSNAESARNTFAIGLLCTILVSGLPVIVRLWRRRI